jgi:hypothetical protein
MISDGCEDLRGREGKTVVLTRWPEMVTLKLKKVGVNPENPSLPVENQSRRSSA